MFLAVLIREKQVIESSLVYGIFRREVASQYLVKTWLKSPVFYILFNFLRGKSIFILRPESAQVNCRVGHFRLEPEADSYCWICSVEKCWLKFQSCCENSALKTDLLFSPLIREVPIFKLLIVELLQTHLGTPQIFQRRLAGVSPHVKSEFALCLKFIVDKVRHPVRVSPHILFHRYVEQKRFVNIRTTCSLRAFLSPWPFNRGEDSHVTTSFIEGVKHRKPLNEHCQILLSFSYHINLPALCKSRSLSNFDGTLYPAGYSFHSEVFLRPFLRLVNDHLALDEVQVKAVLQRHGLHADQDSAEQLAVPKSDQQLLLTQVGVGPTVLNTFLEHRPVGQLRILDDWRLGRRLYWILGNQV